MWENENRSKVIIDILKSNKRVLVSSGWYLDQQFPSLRGTTHYLWQDTFLDFYSNEIEDGLEAVPKSELTKIIGGEVWFVVDFGSLR